VTLTLGIGVSTGIFALVNAFWLRPPVEKDPGSFVRLFVYNSQPSFNFGQPGSISLEDYREYETAHSLAELAAWHQVRPVFGAMNPKRFGFVQLLLCVWTDKTRIGAAAAARRMLGDWPEFRRGHQ
jgi:hypothetical protein